MNIAEIVKTFPSETELYCTVSGKVIFSQIIEDKTLGTLIEVYCKYGKTFLNKEGLLRDKGECILFPSKEVRDWNNWRDAFVVTHNIVSYNSLPWLVITKDKEHYLLGLDLAPMKIEANILNRIYPCSENVKEEFTSELIERNVELTKDGWFIIKSKINFDKTTDQKFDFTTLKPFDHILVRDHDTETWGIELFEYFTQDENKNPVFITSSGEYYQCVPFNEETEHLVRKHAYAPEHYIIWE